MAAWLPGCLAAWLIILPITSIALGQTPPGITHSSNVTTGLWSATTSWSPAAGQPAVPGWPNHNIWIQAGHTITLDQDIKCVNNITVDGKLILGNNVTYLEFHKLHIRAGGVLEIGTAGSPFLGNLEIAICEDTSTSTPGMIKVDAGDATTTPVTPGGRLEIRGNPNGRPEFSSLYRTMEPGDTWFDCAGTTQCWQVNDKVVVASTDYDTHQAEEFTITGVTVMVDETTTPPATFTRYSTATSALYRHFVGELSVGQGGTKSMFIAAEVALLNRNIHIHGEVNPTVAGQGGQIEFGTGPGGPVVAPATYTAPPQPNISMVWVEVSHLGNRGQLGDYPIHFHWCGDMSGMALIQSCSIRDNYNRSLTIHRTQGVTVTKNLSYRTIGHAFFLESGLERNCKFLGNVGISTMAEDPANGLLHHADDEPATFWFTTFHGTFTDNVAAGSEGTGFWFECNHESYYTQGMEPTTSIASGTNVPSAQVSAPAYTATWQFDRNTAHSNLYHGYFGDLSRSYMYGPADSMGGYALVVNDFMAYKCGQYGLFTRNYGHVSWDGLRIADCQIALYAATTAYPQADCEAITTFKDAVVIGASNNTGSDFDNEESSAGRSLFQYYLSSFDPDGAVYGLELYDGLIILDDAEFLNFNDLVWEDGNGNERHRFSAAITTRVVDLKYAIDPRNTVMNTSFSNVYRKIYFRRPPSPSGQPGAQSPYNAINNTTIWDVDGSITGFPSFPAGVTQPVTEAYIVADIPTLLPSNASKSSVPGSAVAGEAIWMSQWNAWISPHLPADQSATPPEPGRGIVQVIFVDTNHTFGWGGSGNNAEEAFLTLTRQGSSQVFYKAYHGHEATTQHLSNIYPANIKQGHVYDVTMPTATDPNASPSVAQIGSFEVTVRFANPGDWVVLKIPVSGEIVQGNPTPFDPVNKANHRLKFIVHQRLDCVVFPSMPLLHGVEEGIPVNPVFPNDFGPQPQPALLEVPGLNVFDAAVGAPLTIPQSPNAGAVTSPPAGHTPGDLAWYYDGTFLYLRMVVMDELGLSNWFLPKTGSAVADTLYTGGAVRVKIEVVPDP